MQPRSQQRIVSVLTPSVPWRHSFSRAFYCHLIVTVCTSRVDGCASAFYSEVDVCASALLTLKSMSVHRLCLASLYIYFYFFWPIACIGPHILLSVIPHTWEIFLEMLTIDSNWELHPAQLLTHVRIAL